MTQLTIQLPDRIADHLAAQVVAGRSNSVSEFVETVLDRQLERDDLEAKVLEADQDNQATPVTPEYWSSLRELARQQVWNP